MIVLKLNYVRYVCLRCNIRLSFQKHSHVCGLTMVPLGQGPGMTRLSMTMVPGRKIGRLVPTRRLPGLNRPRDLGPRLLNLLWDTASRRRRRPKLKPLVNGNVAPFPNVNVFPVVVGKNPLVKNENRLLVPGPALKNIGNGKVPGAAVVVGAGVDTPILGPKGMLPRLVMILVRPRPSLRVRPRPSLRVRPRPLGVPKNVGKVPKLVTNRVPLVLPRLGVPIKVGKLGKLGRLGKVVLGKGTVPKLLTILVPVPVRPRLLVPKVRGPPTTLVRNVRPRLPVPNVVKPFRLETILMLPVRPRLRPVPANRICLFLLRFFKNGCTSISDVGFGTCINTTTRLH